ncbi:MAG: DUF5320 domain-containing protein [Candidatus Pacebacteria bacterium]|nr:DUF5320 domain-containing protein [Candidatus Paceibacterota bacterium]
MPKFDGTGPAGKGPKTGAQMGKCDDAKPQEARPFDGRGEGKGRNLEQQGGFGRGRQGFFGRLGFGRRNR